MVEVLSEKTSFSNKNESFSVSGTVCLINFRRLQLDKEKGVTSVSITGESIESRDLYHCIAGLYSACLPDMEVDAIYSTLNKPSQTIVAMATKQDVVRYRQKFGPPHKIELTKEVAKQDNNEGEEFDSGDLYCKVFSESEDDDDVSSTEEENNNNDEQERETFETERIRFLEGIQNRRLLDNTDLDSVGVEDRLIGCITFMRLSSKPGDLVSQILLLAIRHRWRGYGIGGYLIRLCKDPSIIGRYDMLLAYADHKAESFFNRYGFTDDPIITARHKQQTDYWENSTIMAYIPPYSVHNSSSSLKTVELLDDQLKKWRVMSMATHCDQVCIMERLKQEILLLMSRVTSQEEVIDALHKELRDTKRSHRTMEVEYELYRLQTQNKLVRLTEERARHWIMTTEGVMRSNLEVDNPSDTISTNVLSTTDTANDQPH